MATDSSTPSSTSACLTHPHRLDALADDILAMAQAGHGRLELDRRDVDIPALLRRCAGWLEADELWVTIEASPGLRALVDPDRVE